MNKITEMEMEFYYFNIFMPNIMFDIPRYSFMECLSGVAKKIACVCTPSSVLFQIISWDQDSVRVRDSVLVIIKKDSGSTKNFHEFTQFTQL